MCFLHRCGGKSLGWVRSALILSNFSFLPSLFFHFSTFSLCSAGVRCSFFFCFIVHERVCVYVCSLFAGWCCWCIYYYYSLLCWQWNEHNWRIMFSFFHFGRSYSTLFLSVIFLSCYFCHSDRKKELWSRFSHFWFFFVAVYMNFFYTSERKLWKKTNSGKKWAAVQWENSVIVVESYNERITRRIMRKFYMAEREKEKEGKRRIFFCGTVEHTMDVFFMVNLPVLYMFMCACMR